MIEESGMGGYSKEQRMTVCPSQQEKENGMMEAACPQAVKAGLANSGGVSGTPPPSAPFS